jgi:hypothetical protein
MALSAEATELLNDIWDTEKNEGFRVYDVRVGDPGVSEVVDGGYVSVVEESGDGDLVVRLSADGYGAVDNPRRATRSPQEQLALLRAHKAEAQADLRTISRYRGEEPRVFREGVKREIAKIQAEIDALEAQTNPASGGLLRGIVTLSLTALGVTGIVMGIREARHTGAPRQATYQPPTT